eukprot:PLAT11239.1.p1 GENE.PLAT11239.1~~PLAT11239.1.p1  ORF type:complete len:375 (-),score=144.36 PLAT11239.1:50-1072(-)
MKGDVGGVLDAVGIGSCNGKRVVDCSKRWIARSNLKPCGNWSHSEHPDVRRFAVVGDYGTLDGDCAARVSLLLSALEEQTGPMQFLLSTGDNAYYQGECGMLEAVAGSLYGRFFKPGSCHIDELPTMPKPLAEQRFFPTMGNHDWDSWAAAGRPVDDMPYSRFFNYLHKLGPADAFGAYYTVLLPGMDGRMQLFTLNSNIRGGRPLQQQRDWLRAALAASRAAVKIVMWHHPVHSTTTHDPPAAWMDWPLAEWGATLVLNGHQHVYERMQVDGVTRIINGLGGNPMLYSFNGCTAAEASQKRYNRAHGLLMGVSTASSLDLCFYSVERSGQLVDHVSIAL